MPIARAGGRACFFPDRGPALAEMVRKSEGRELAPAVAYIADW